jgi:hypothetical protein
MPKPIKELIPSSSVAKILDLSVAALAVQSPSPGAVRDAPPYIALSERTRDTIMAAPLTPMGELQRPTHTLSVRAGESVRGSSHARSSSPTYAEFSPTLSRQFTLTPRTDATTERLVELFRRVTRTRMTTSHVMRAVLKALQHGMPEIERAARSIGPTPLPSNAKGGEVERERFEAFLADAIVAGMRASAAYAGDNALG